MIKLAKSSKCTGCMVCVDACPKSAIDGVIGQDGHYYPRIDESKCVECKLCTKACPVISAPHSNSTGMAVAYGAWSDVNDYRKTSTSGAVFPTIAKYVIENGGCAIGVTMEDSIANHIVIDNVADISLLQGSKYQQSDTRNIYRQCKDILKSGKQVVFSGTPCQVAGLHSYLKRDYPNLITVDVICAGVPSKLVVDKYRSVKPDMKLISYRDKVGGWHGGLCVTSEEDRKIVRKSKDGYIFGQAVAGHQTDRYSCYNCQFATVDRVADITIGDFWGGDKVFPEQKQKGISVLVVRSSKGEEILKKSGVSIHETELTTAFRHNPRILFGKNLTGRYKLERRFMKWLIPIMPYNLYAALYAGVYNSKIYLPIKLYRYIMWKIDTRYVKNRIANIIKKNNGH